MKNHQPSTRNPDMIAPKKKKPKGPSRFDLRVKLASEDTKSVHPLQWQTHQLLDGSFLKHGQLDKPIHAQGDDLIVFTLSLANMLGMGHDCASLTFNEIIEAVAFQYNRGVADGLTRLMGSMTSRALIAPHTVPTSICYDLKVDDNDRIESAEILYLVSDRDGRVTGFSHVRTPFIQRPSAPPKAMQAETQAA